MFFFTVTWDVNPFNSYAFADVPRTTADAEADDWKALDEPGTCKGERLSIRSCIIGVCQ